MKIKHNKFLIMLVSVLFIGGGYLYFSRDTVDSRSLVPIAYGSSLATSDGNEVSALAGLSGSEKISSDIAFLKTLVSLEKIKIDTAFFKNKYFIALQNNAVKIEPVEAGRNNPFAPIQTISVKDNPVVIQKVVTNQPTDITDKSAVLNGTINQTEGVTDIYFEYGNTDKLGTVTGTVKASLVGTFIKSVLGLTPKTNYFSRACAKINNIATCGEIVSFTTK